jgi:hypothetical protein
MDRVLLRFLAEVRGIYLQLIIKTMIRIGFDIHIWPPGKAIYSARAKPFTSNIPL